jgi:hypothetical protein
MKQLTISFAKLDGLEYIKEGNRLPNLEEFVKKSSHAPNLEALKNNFFDKTGKVDEANFWHVIGTLLLNAKNNISGNYGNFGMEYSGMVVTTYVNHSNPCLLEFFIIR